MSKSVSPGDLYTRGQECAMGMRLKSRINEAQFHQISLSGDLTQMNGKINLINLTRKRGKRRVAPEGPLYE